MGARRRLAGPVLIGCVMFLLPACGGDSAPAAFCDAARDISTFDANTDPDTTLATFETLAEEAPDEIKDAATTANDAIQGLAAGDTSAAGDYETALTEISAYLDDNCEAPE